MALKNLADKLYSTFMKNFPNESSEVCKIFLSASDMKTRAVVRNASATSPKEAWEIALEELKKILKSEKIDPVILRADWVISSEKITWENFIKLVEDTRRNYFRKGLALDSDYKIAFTEMEMNGNAMLYQGGKEGSAYGVFRQNRSDTYCQKRFGMDFPTPSPTDTVEIFETQGVFIQENEEPKFITGKDIYAGRRDTSTIDSELFMTLAKNGAKYLAGQVQKSGKFIYGYHTCFHNQIKTYNTLRHMSSTFAMLDVYGAYKKMPPIKLGKAIINAVEYAVKKFISYRTLDDGTRAAYLADPFSEEIKLGGNGVSLLALVKYTELMHTKKYLPLMKELANGILSMQNPDGSFVHVLNTSDFSVKEPFRIVYYDGEAVFGMLRLYSITKDEKLLQASVLAFERFIKTNHWRNHDHWLSYAVNELTSYKPEAKYFEFGINNFLGFLSFIYHRDTQFPTLMELMMAADTMLERLKTMPEMSELLQRVNFNDFYAALEKRAENLLNGYFWPELAMYFAKPEVIAGSFFIRHHAFRVRIDDVEHYLSGFVAYCRYLERRKNLPAPVPTQKLLGGKAEGTGIFNIQSTEVTLESTEKVITESNEEKKFSPLEVNSSNLDTETAEKINFQIDNPDEVDIEDFKKKLKSNNAEIFFMLDNIEKNAPGLELSAFRRAKFFKKYFDVNVCFMINAFQNNIQEQINHYQLDSNFLNMYDYFQEIDRKNFVSSNQTVLINPDKNIYRDTYDPLGFLSRRKKFDSTIKQPSEIIYYRPDGTEALFESYEFVNNENVLKSAELIGRDKTVIKKFSSRKELISYWVLSVLNDKEKKYILIGDRGASYIQTYINIKTNASKNFYVFHVIHNTHFIGSNPSKSRIRIRNCYLYDDRLQANGIIVFTQHQKEDILRRFQLNNVFVVPHSLKDFSPSAVEVDPFKIIFVGRLVEQKDPVKTLEAFKIVSQAVPQAHLHFYGEGGRRRELKEKIELYGLQDKVFFEGFVTNIADVYCSAALSLCTSKFEGFSMSNQESLQLGCPVVSFDCNYGPSDMIIDGVNGFLVKPGDVETMAQKIILILQNPELRQTLSKNAPDTVQKYAPPVVAKKWANLFSDLLTDELPVNSEETIPKNFETEKTFDETNSTMKGLTETMLKALQMLGIDTSSPIFSDKTLKAPSDYLGEDFVLNSDSRNILCRACRISDRDLNADYNIFRSQYLAQKPLKKTETDITVYFCDYMLFSRPNDCDIHDYFDFEFYNKSLEVQQTFICGNNRRKHNRVGNDRQYVRVLAHKFRTNKLFSDFIHRDWIITTECTFEEFKNFVTKHPKFFSKTNFGGGGKGVEVVQIDSDSDLENIFSRLKSEERLLEEPILQNEIMKSFCPDTLNTVRINTFLDIHNVVHILTASGRFGRLGNIVDNFHGGGFSVTIDVKTGIIISDGLNRVHERLKKHPDTGKIFRGFQYPFWEKVCKTVIQMAKKIPQMRHVGWDIAINAQGDIDLVEANDAPATDVQQAPDSIGRFYLYKPLVEELENYNSAMMKFLGYRVNNLNNFNKAYETDSGRSPERLQLAIAKLSANCLSLLDLGCRENKLVKTLCPDNVKYYPVDYKNFDDEVIVCDFNKGEFPNIKVDACLCAYTAEYVTCLPEFLKKMCTSTLKQILMLCRPVDKERRFRYRWNHPFQTDFTEQFLIETLEKNNFKLNSAVSCQGNSSVILYDFRRIM
ncbi:MAG: glycosyltransferase [Selenomonadaceae bacterium]|nr:glycosyltransferase [Selenomonadaceae bacterium]